MRKLRLAIILVFSGATLWVGLAYAAGGPPVIKESFTLLPCPAHPSTTLALEGCAEKGILKTDAKINARVKSIYGKLRTGNGKLAFVRGEKAWLSYRRASCSAQASKYAGGTLEALAFAQCELSRNKIHITELTKFEAARRP